MTTPSPLAGIRVLELSTGQPGRTAGMLLADLGADVVRVGSGDGSVPEELVWDRGKRTTAPEDKSELLRLALAADVVLDDGGSAREGAALVARSPTLVHVAMPSYGAAGRWRDLAADPLLVTALGGFATFHPSHEPGAPVASAVPMVSAIHGALGALLAAAGVLGVRRGHGGRAVETTGLHASAACLASLVVEGIDAPDMVTPDGRVGSRPSFRTYRCADDRYLHLSTLTVEFFLPALTALDRMDVMVLPGVDGDFLNIMRPDIGRRVGAELERTFAERPRDEWLEILTDAGVPCAPVLPREKWLTSDIVAATAPPTTVEHPDLGPVVLPGAPWALSDAVPTIRHLGSSRAHTVPASSLWREQRPAAARSAPADLPLTGLRVIDLSTFFAAPFSAALLADLGATVVKTEPPRGDPYSVFTASYAAVNHAKTLATVDLRGDAGRTRFTELLGKADVLVDNLRPAAAERLGMTDDVLATTNPRLVRGSVSAFGRSGPFADLPGFDPVLQSRSGLAAAQGGADEPVPTSAPTIDVATGVVTALGLLAALIERETTGEGGHVTTSLAATSTFLQAAELVAYEGRAPTEQGGRDYRGPEPARRFHRATDGWLALAAATDAQRSTVRTALGLESLTHEAVATVLATRPVEHWIRALGEHGIPVCTVAPRDGFLTDPYLTANDYAQVVRDPRLGRFRLTRGYFRPVVPRPVAGERTPWPEVEDLPGEVRPGFAVVPDPAEPPRREAH